jgi:hypothetical protein
MIVKDSSQPALGKVPFDVEQWHLGAASAA